MAAPLVYNAVISSLLVTLVSSQQRYRTEPTNVEAIRGTTIILPCLIDNVQGAVQWTRNGFGLGTDRELRNYPRYNFVGSEALGEYNLMISNIQLEDDAEYECQVGATATSEGMRSKAAQVTVLLPPDVPVIESGPVVNVVADQPYNLTCTAANGRPAPNISWYSGGTELEGSQYYTSSLQADGKREDVLGVLTITPRKGGDQGRRYECHVMNAALIQEKWTRVSLEVLYLPVVTMTVEPTKRVREFSAMAFRCEAFGNPNVITWRWLLEGIEISGATSSYMELSAVTREHHGKMVSCEANNDVGGTRQSYTLNVEYGPKFMSGPVHAAVDLGQDATLSCQVDGNPPPAIIWTRKESTRILSSSPTMTVSGVSSQELGTYVCLASVIGFDEVTMDQQIVKKGPPRITSERDQYARFGDMGVVECSMWSLPKPSGIMWRKDGKILDVALLKRYAVREEELSMGRRSFLEIQSVQEEDYADYNCTVKNDYGQDSLVVKFRRKDVVPLAYILAGVLAGIILLLIIGIIIFVYHRKRVNDSDSNSEGSDANLKKKSNDGSPDISGYGKAGSLYGNNLENWQQDPYRYSAEYDELKYPPREPRLDHPDSGYPYNYNPDYPTARSDYGTYPGRRIDPRLDPIYGPVSHYSDNVYGTYRPGHTPGGSSLPPVRPGGYAASDYGVMPPPSGTLPPPGPPRNYAASDYGPLPPASSLPSSRLSTNV